MLIKCVDINLFSKKGKEAIEVRRYFMRKIIAAGLALMTILLAGCDGSWEIGPNDDILLLQYDSDIESYHLNDSQLENLRLKVLCGYVRETDKFIEYDIPAQRDIGAVYAIRDKDSFIVRDPDFTEIGLLGRDGTYQKLVECDESQTIDYYDHNDEYLIFTRSDEDIPWWLATTEYGVYCFADGTSEIFNELYGLITQKGVFIEDKFYYYCSVTSDDNGEEIHTDSMFSYDVKTKESRLVSENVSNPMKYKGKLACVSEDKVVELSDDGSMTTLFSLADMGLEPGKVIDPYCTEDIITYSYYTYRGESASGRGVAFLKDGEKHFVAEEKAASYISDLVFCGDNAVWDFGMSVPAYPMFYNIKKDQVMVLNAHKANFYPLISKEAVYFVEMREQKPSIVEYKF